MTGFCGALHQMETKTCNKCGQDLPLDEFHKNSCTKDGRHTACKFCRCSYSAMTTDHEAKRASQRRIYDMKKGNIKAQRIAFKMLVDLEAALGVSSVDPLPNSQRKVSHVIQCFVPDAAVQRISELLDTHIGLDRYLTGYGNRWKIWFVYVPRPSLKNLEDPCAFVQDLMQPDNIVFMRLF